MEKLIGVSGSLRRGSFNTALLQAAATQMPAGSTLDIRTLHGIPLYDADDEAERGIPPAVAALKEAIAAADGVILATPEYNNSIPGVFKNAIDWLSRPPADITRVFRGKPVVPQRFAVDWTLLGEDGLLFRGDRTDVTNWYAYGAPVYAAATGIVGLVRDGSPDRPAFGAAPPAVMAAADAPGNVVVIDSGQGRFATYAHLKPGSLRVAKGDRVVEGQLLAQLGNSGNTLGPHLHFHVSDAVEPLGGEGLPFALQSFELAGRIASLPALLAGSAWTPNAAQPARAVAGEMPLENMVVRFRRDGSDR